MEKDQVIEISQVANGFIVRRAPGHWFKDEQNNTQWTGISGDYYVFQSIAELVMFLSVHFTHRSTVVITDAK